MGWVVNATPRPLYHLEDSVTVLQDAGWTSGPVWTGAENAASTGISFFNFRVLCTSSVLVYSVCLYLQQTRHISMPPARFEPTIPESDRPQILVLDRSVTLSLSVCTSTRNSLSWFSWLLHFCLYCTIHNTNIHASGGIRTRSLSKRSAVDPRLRPLRHLGRLMPQPFYTRERVPVPTAQETGWAPVRSGRVRKISPPPWFNFRNFHPVASRYTDWAFRGPHFW